MSEKIMFVTEVPIKTSVGILYDMLTTPSGLSDWFCDDVNIDGDVYSFFWEGEAEKAELLRKSKNEFVKFKWTEDEEDDTYFELRIKIDGITKDVALVVTDFADDEEEVEENTLLWTSQINDLKRVIGA
ncbi:MAG: START-like domain-containing protein [Flavobacteriales bacterium]